MPAPVMRVAAATDTASGDTKAGITTAGSPRGRRRTRSPTRSPSRDPPRRAEAPMATEPRDTRSVPELLSDLLRETTELFRAEGKLIRAEISEKIRQVEMGGGSLVAGAICLLVALFVLAQALIVALGDIIGDAWAALLVGIVIAEIGRAHV